MQLWVCCALLVFVAGGCLAQKPRPCRTPPLFEGSFSVLAQNGDYLALWEYSYDAILQRVYFGEFVAAENYTKVPVMYLMDYKQQTCKKQALTSKFSPMEVPANASLLAQVVLGSLSASGEGVLVNTWTGDLPEVQGQYVMTFTEFGCFPVSALYRMPKMDLILYNLFNNVRGIKDPSVFIPPPFCEHATVKPGEGNIFSAFF